LAGRGGTPSATGGRAAGYGKKTGWLTQGLKNRKWKKISTKTLFTSNLLKEGRLAEDQRGILPKEQEKHAGGVENT